MAESELEDVKKYLAATKAALAGAPQKPHDLSHKNLAKANFEGRSLVRARLMGSNLREARLARAELVEADLFGANLS